MLTPAEGGREALLHLSVSLESQGSAASITVCGDATPRTRGRAGSRDETGAWKGTRDESGPRDEEPLDGWFKI